MNDQETKTFKPNWENLRDLDKQKYIDRVIFLIESEFIPVSPFESSNIELLAKNIYNSK